MGKILTNCNQSPNRRSRLGKKKNLGRKTQRRGGEFKDFSSQADLFCATGGKKKRQRKDARRKMGKKIQGQRGPGKGDGDMKLRLVSERSWSRLNGVRQVEGEKGKTGKEGAPLCWSPSREGGKKDWRSPSKCVLYLG